MKKYNKVIIVGVGLIGGSIGKALLKTKKAAEVIGVCRRKNSLAKALKCGAITEGYVNDYKKALNGADLVVIATPVGRIKEVMIKIADCVKPGTIVTDAGSTKKVIVECGEGFSGKFNFVGSHPLAGAEKAGCEFSDEDLFKNALCVVTKTPKTDKAALDAVKKLWLDIGAKVKVIDPAKHDAIVSFTSHLPHVAAFALAGVQKKDFSEYIATGFKDTARIAGSDPAIWRAVFETNREEILKAIKIFEEMLKKIAAKINTSDYEGLEKILNKCKGFMDGIS